MKKRVIYLVVLIALIFGLTGCIKANVNMEISKCKEMNIEFIYAIDKDLFKDKDEYSSGLFDKDYLDNYKKKGYKVIDYNSDKMKGYIFSKKIDNIDLYSSKKDVVVDFSDYVNKPDADKMFQVKEGFLKNHYKASFKINKSSSKLDEEELAKYYKDMDLSFNLKLPYSAISNNANKSNDSNKNLSWDLIKSSEIEFEFVLFCNYLCKK